MQQYTNVCNTSTTSRQLLLVENVSNETWCCYQGYENKSQANKFPTFIHLKPEEQNASLGTIDKNNQWHVKMRDIS